MDFKNRRDDFFSKFGGCIHSFLWLLCSLKKQIRWLLSFLEVPTVICEQQIQIKKSLEDMDHPNSAPSYPALEICERHMDEVQSALGDLFANFESWRQNLENRLEDELEDIREEQRNQCAQEERKKGEIESSRGRGNMLVREVC